MIRVNIRDTASVPGAGYLDCLYAHHPLLLADTLTIEGVMYVVEDQMFFTDHQGPVQTVLVNRCHHI